MTLRVLHTHIHTHTHNYTHTQMNHPYIQCMWKVPCYPTVGTLSWLQKESNLEKHVNWHHFTNILGKKTYYHLYVNEEGNPNPPGSMPEAITGIEIISSKSVMDTIATVSQTWNYWLPGSIADSSIWNRVANRHWYGKYFTTNFAPTHRHKQTHRVAMSHEY
jgi:hypothetical protein